MPLLDVLEFYKKNYLGFFPDITVIVVSVNDNYTRIKRDLPQLLELNKELGTKSILVDEAKFYYSEKDDADMVEVHGLMARIGSRYNVISLPLHDYLKKVDQLEQGVLWWDMVHFTDYGHKVVSDWLTPEIGKIWKPSQR